MKLDLLTSMIGWGGIRKRLIIFGLGLVLTSLVVFGIAGYAFFISAIEATLMGSSKNSSKDGLNFGIIRA